MMSHTSSVEFSRRSLLLASSGIVAGISGCSGISPLSQTPCEAVKDTLQLMDDGKYKEAAQKYTPHALDDEAGVNEYAEALRGVVQILTFGGFEKTDFQSIDCLCTESIPNDTYSEESVNSGLWEQFFDDLSHLVVVQIRTKSVTGQEQQSTDTGFSIAYKVNGQGWFVIPTGLSEEQIPAQINKCN